MADVDGVEIEWCEESCDRPLTGVARAGDRRYWFTPASAGWARERPRRYSLYELSPSALADLAQRYRDADSLSQDAYWAKYHPVDRDEWGFQARPGQPIGQFNE